MEGSFADELVKPYPYPYSSAEAQDDPIAILHSSGTTLEAMQSRRALPSTLSYILSTSSKDKSNAVEQT